MKKIFGVFVAVLLAAQSMLFPAATAAQEATPAVEDEVVSEAPAEADVTFTFSDIRCSPGDEIAVTVSMESSVDINSVALSNLTYDKDRLEFLGFANFGPVLQKSFFGEAGIDREKNTVVIGLMKSEPLTGKICDLKFRVKDGYGVANVSMDTVVKNNANVYTSSVDAALVAAGYADFTLGTVISKGDGTVEVPISIHTPTPINSIAIYDFEYDTSLLTFAGYSNYGEIVTGSLFGDGGLDVENQAITIGMMDTKPLSGHICNLVFAVNDGVISGETEINVTTLVKNFNEVIYSDCTSTVAVLGEANFDIRYTQGDLGDTVYVDVIAEEGASPVDFIEFSDLVYDTSRLTFEGFSVGEETVKADSFVIPMEGVSVPTDVVCRLVFRVNEEAVGGIADISLSSTVKNGDAVFSSAVDSGFVAVGCTEVRFGNVWVEPGDSVDVEIYINSTAPIQSVEIMQITYDPAVLTFDGLTFESDLINDYGWYGENGELFITILPVSGALLTDITGTMRFTAAEGVEDCLYELNPTEVITLNQMIPFLTKVTAGSVKVEGPVLGDLGGDHNVDLSDALTLFQNAMMPELYPVEYEGKLDLTDDGQVDIQDSLRLFQYAMMPDLYPIEW